MTRELALGLGLAVGGAAYLAMSWYVWRRRAAAGGTSLVVALLGIFVWTACYAVELSTNSVAAAQVWSGLKYIGVVLVPAALWAFVRQYTLRRPLRRSTVALLCIEPAIVLLLLALPATRDLIHYYRPQDVAGGTLRGPPVAQPGPLLWPHALYSWALLLVALGTFVARVGRIGGPYRRQANVLVVVSLLPLLGNIVYNTDLFGLGAVDPAPFLFTIFTFVLVWGIFRLRLLDLVPVARGALVAQMVDGVVVLDVEGRVADANAAAAAVVGVPRSALVGRYVDDVLPDVVPLLAWHAAGGRTDGQLELERNDVRRHYAVSVSSLTDRTKVEIARLVVLRDVTERVDVERRLRELLDDRTRLADTLQAGLRPQLLPAVPGVRIAARWIPAGGISGRVSGDFYDVHQTLGGDYAVVLGDVAGKGVHAAVVTSMARYTMRTLSAQGWSPGRVLEQLNQALLTDVDAERFCTVLYGRIAQDPVNLDTDWSPGVQITLALGGHPQPLVRWLDGSVTAVGHPGTALGLLSRVDIKEEKLQLQPGEVLVAYTDGVTEARSGAEQFGEQRLADCVAAAAEELRGKRGPAAAALVADAVADRVLEAVESFSCERDDVAVLVVVAE
jgi:PAS domain S-box-containing protein